MLGQCISLITRCKLYIQNKLAAYKYIQYRMSGQKRCHEDDTGRFAVNNNSEFTQVKKTRVVVDSNYLALANTLDTRLDTLTSRIEHMLSQLNTRLGNLETTVRNLSGAVETMQVTVCDTVAMTTGIITGSEHNQIVGMETGSPMDIGTPSRANTHAPYYA